MTKKRQSLHRQLAEQQSENEKLKHQISQLQGLANIGVATSMIAHEINNLLTPVSVYAALALKETGDKALVEKVLQKVIANCERASKVMESILGVGNGQCQEKGKANLKGMVEEIFDCLCRDFAKDGITVEVDISDDLEVWGILVQIQQVLMNLILNARDAMLGRGGVLRIRAEEDGDDSVRIWISDTGCGIKKDELEKIFELFYSTKGNGGGSGRTRGTGLGLAFCKRVVEEHGGCIWARSEHGKGTTFEMRLPKPQRGSN